MNLRTLTDILSDLAKKPFDYPTQERAKNLIITSRANLIRQQFEKTGFFPQSSLIDICLPMDYISSTTCCGIDLGCKLSTTKNVIPRPIEVKSRINFNFVGGINGIKGYDFIDYDSVRFLNYLKYSKKDARYTYINNKIVIFNEMPLSIKLRYIPANPLELLDIKNCSDKPCWDIEDTFLIEDNWEDAIVKMVLPKLLSVLNQQIPVSEEVATKEI